ncbi:methylthioribulose 1-phosphate dehydratase [Paracidobacterium acidisoli]|uniref:Methylthioribulose-1-phosphate dehydratase n=1 Tax=Paracidobacterium acidisoli TaxID=2303751 RepID=A0A372IPP6_9BACT|nr:methylthioribulose 1-phosphate dehydratase [Paracidobacterium acidisoli]MBT9331030.1 methylthioribulose 1-phosphate dehydratase [Paracidobacterium acidisoli]
MLEAAEAVRQLTQAGAALAGRGWLQGTSGNLSATLASDPLRLLITSSGQNKGNLTPQSFVHIDEQCRVLQGEGRPSAEAALHAVIVRQRSAGSVQHVHSPWATVLSGFYAGAKGITIAGYEMLKGLSGVTTHEHSEWLPVLENSQNYTQLSAELETLLREYPDIHGVLLRGHGLYTWGADVAEAQRHVEIIEFLLEVAGTTDMLRGRFAQAQ